MNCDVIVNHSLYTCPLRTARKVLQICRCEPAENNSSQLILRSRVSSRPGPVLVSFLCGGTPCSAFCVAVHLAPLFVWRYTLLRFLCGGTPCSALCVAVRLAPLYVWRYALLRFMCGGTPCSALCVATHHAPLFGWRYALLRF